MFLYSLGYRMAVLWHSISCVWFGKSCAKASEVCTRNSAHKGPTIGAFFPSWPRNSDIGESINQLKMMFLQESILIVLLRFSPCKLWSSTQVLMHQCYLRCLGTPDTSTGLQESCTPLVVVQLGPGRWNGHKMPNVCLVDFCLYRLSVEYPVVVIRTREKQRREVHIMYF